MAFSPFFLLPGIAESTGPSLPLAFFAAAIFMLPAILSICELSAAMPRSGGPYFFVTRSLGPLLGLIGAFGKFIQLILKGAFAFVGFGIYASMLLDVPIQGIAVFLIMFFTIINLFGTRETANAEKVLVVVLLVILSYFLTAGANEVFTGTTNLAQNFQPLSPYGWDGFFSAIALVFISFGGVAQVASVAEEVKNPGRSFPKGMLWSLAVSSFFYIAGTALIIALLSPEILRGNETPAATAAEQISALPLPFSLIVIAAFAAFASTGNAAILAASRYPLALSRDRILWKKFGELNKKRVPRNSEIFTGILSIALVLLLNVQEIAKIASAFLLFVFLTMCIAVIVFRESHKKDYQPKYKSPLYPWLQITGSFIYIWLIWESGLKAMGFIAGVFLLGLLWYHYGIKERPNFSAAIFHLFQRIGRQEKKDSHLGDIALSFESLDLTAPVEDADFIDLEKEESFDEAVHQAAETLRHRLGGKKERIEEIVKEEMEQWKHPSERN